MSVQIVQIMIILFFIYSVKMKIWKQSLNTFIVFATLFILTISREVEYLRKIWIDYHVSVIGLMMIVLMSRVVYQSVYKKYKDAFCNDCTNYNRRSTDSK